MDLPSDTPPSRLEVIALAHEAYATSRREFVEAHPHQFLLARPDDGDGDEYDEEMEFDTVAIRPTAVDEQAVQEWLALPLVWPSDASPGHRLSFGRANSCDIVIRMSFVSKMHGFIELGSDGQLCVGDYRSSNGTQVNGHRIGPNERGILALGDRLRIGLLSLQLVDALRLYRALSSSAFTSWEIQHSRSKRQ